MSSADSRFKIWLPVVLSLSLGAIGGIVFSWAQAPLPWLLGALVANLVTSLLGVPLAIPNPLRNVGLATLGTAIGGAFHPGILDRIVAWPLSLFATLFVAIVTVPLARWLMRRCLAVTGITALVATIPGAFSAMVLIANDVGADIKTVTITHATRVMLVVMAVPLLVSEGSGVSAGPLSDTDWPGSWQWLVLIGCTVLGPLAGIKARLPAAMLIGAMLLSACIHLSGVSDAQVPSPVVSVVQVITGAWLGGRFQGLDKSALLSTFAVAVLVTLIALVPVFVMASVLHSITGLGFYPLVLAFAPGGMPEMALVALSLEMDPSFVVVHHLFRMLVIVVLAPILISRYQARESR